MQYIPVSTHPDLCVNFTYDKFVLPDKVIRILLNFFNFSLMYYLNKV